MPEQVRVLGGDDVADLRWFCAVLSDHDRGVRRCGELIRWPRMCN